MAVKIRLKRMGAKKKPFYRVVVADSRSPRDGRFIEELGWFDPLKDPAEFKIDVQAARKWLGDGAKPTDTAKALLRKAGVYEVPEEDDHVDAVAVAVDEPAVEAPVAADEPVAATTAVVDEPDAEVPVDVDEPVAEAPVTSEATAADSEGAEEDQR
jgi:small subunit ribosomal protein S16